jgi:hypothetical protein
MDYRGRNLIPMLAVAALLLAAPIWAQTSANLPPKWDPRIPLPKGATLISSTQPKAGVVYSADFAAPGTYKDLVNFYETELPKAGFSLGSKVASPARKVYSRSFSAFEILDSVVITPDPKNPSKFVLQIAYTPPAKSNPKAP